MPRRLIYLTVMAAFASTLVRPTQADEGRRVLGFTEPNLNVEVAFSQPGRLNSINIREGDAVREGGLLARLEDSDLAVAQSIAEVRAGDKSQIAAAEAERDSIQSRLSDLQSLVESGGASADEIRRVTSEIAVAEAKVQTAQSEQRVQELEVDRLKALRQLRKLTCPIDGYVKEIHKRPGEYVSANDPQVVEVVQLDPLKVQFHVPQSEARRLRAKQAVSVSFPQLERSAQATVRRVSPLIDPESGTTLVEVELPNPKLEFQSGLHCELRLPSTTPPPESKESP